MKLFEKNIGYKGGFTILELLVVSAIFVTITTITLIKFSLFNNVILTTNLAYDIALTIRQAQTFGLNVRGFDPGGGTEFNIGYGVHFEDSANNSYILFADLDKNMKYDPDKPELVELFTMGGGHTIKRFCGMELSNVESCTDDSSSPINNLDIVFIRPNPEAFIKSYNPNGDYQDYQRGSITITSPQGVDREVRVYSTGQISIELKP